MVIEWVDGYDIRNRFLKVKDQIVKNLILKVINIVEDAIHDAL